MCVSNFNSIDYERALLAGVSYAIVPEEVLVELIRRVGIRAKPATPIDEQVGTSLDPALDDEALARRLILRRKRVGLTQAALARRAGVRVETLNRIERAKCTPDFATLRKLVVAMNATEREQAVAVVDAAIQGKEND